MDPTTRTGVDEMADRIREVVDRIIESTGLAEDNAIICMLNAGTKGGSFSARQMQDAKTRWRSKGESLPPMVRSK